MRKLELYITLISSISLLFGILTDLQFISIIPDFLVLTLSSYLDVSIAIFQVQSTIATLSIALIALVSGVSNETIYGISIAYYILQIKPIILKHKNTIIILLFLVLLSYIFLAFEMYNSIVAALFITVLLILFMSNEIFRVFQGRDYLKNDIGNYIEANYKDLKILDILYKDILSSINRNDIIKYKENMDLVISMLNKSIDQLKVSETLINKWQTILKEIFEISFTQFRMGNLNFSYYYFDKVYEIIAVKLSESVEFVLWDEINVIFFDSLKWYELQEMDDIDIIHSIRRHLYQSLRFEYENDITKRNNNFLESISTQMYYTFLVNNNKVSKFSKQELFREKKRSYENIFYALTYEQEKYKFPVLFKELLNYTKMLIDRNEIEVINKTFFKELNDTFNSHQMHEDFKAYYFSIIIYLYYLAYKEELASEDLKSSSQLILNNHTNEIYDFLLTVSFQGPVSKELIKKIKSNIAWWEVFSEDEMKVIVLDGVIETFMLYSVLYLELETNQLRESIIAIIDANIFSYVNNYAGTRKKTALENYKEFVNLFFKVNLNNDDVERKMEKLENLLYQFYLENETNDAEIYNSERLIQIESSMRIEVLSNLISKLQPLIGTYSDDNSKNNMYEMNFKVPIKFLESKHLNISETLYNYFLNHIIRLLLNKANISKLEVDFRDKKALVYLFDMIKESDININTIMGYRDWFFGYEKESEFSELLSRVSTVKSDRTSNIIMAVEQNTKLLSTVECTVKIVDVDCEKFFSEIEKNDEDKFLYNVTNDIYIPFDKKDLEEYVNKTLKEIHIVVNYKYSLVDEINGVSVIFQKQSKEVVS